MQQNKFIQVIKSMIKRSGGTVDKIKMDKLMARLNEVLIFNTWNYWLGVKILKNPLDLMILQEIMFEKQPDTIIECGTCYGGSSYYMATMMDLMNIDGKIITIDVHYYGAQAYPKKDFINIGEKTELVDIDLYKVRTHPRIQYIISDCLTANIPKLGTKTMVVLDCDHSAKHVYAELERYSSMVTIGQYIIVEDTLIPNKANGPAGAVEKFLNRNKHFVADRSREKFGITSNPGGHLLRVT